MRSYPEVPPNLVQTPISDPAVYENIGRLLRACADFEHLIDLYLMRLCRLQETEFYVLTGALSISRKIDMAKTLAAQIGGDEADAARAFFTSDLDELIEARNTLAHGHYLGLTEGTDLTFILARHVNDNGQIVGRLVASLPPSTISLFARTMAESLPEVLKAFRVQPLIEAFQHRELGSHPKSARKPLKRRKSSALPKASEG